MQMTIPMIVNGCVWYSNLQQSELLLFNSRDMEHN